MAHTRIQLSKNRVDYSSPIAVSGFYETVEHILIASKKLAGCKGRIIGCILYQEEREEHEQMQHMKAAELAVRILDRSNDFTLYPYAIHNG